jgi:hypothetical protein
MLKTMGAYEGRPCSTLANVRTMTDEVMNRLLPDQQLSLGCLLVGVFPDQVEKIMKRLVTAVQPPLAAFAPYVDFCLRIELFFHLAVDKSRMGSVQRMDLWTGSHLQSRRVAPAVARGPSGHTSILPSQNHAQRSIRLPADSRPIAGNSQLIMIEPPPVNQICQSNQKAKAHAAIRS